MLVSYCNTDVLEHAYLCYHKYSGLNGLSVGAWYPWSISKWVRCLLDIVEVLLVYFELLELYTIFPTISRKMKIIIIVLWMYWDMFALEPHVKPCKHGIIGSTKYLFVKCLWFLFPMSLYQGLKIPAIHHTSVPVHLSKGNYEAVIKGQNICRISMFR